MDWRGIVCWLVWPLIWTLNRLDSIITGVRNNWKVLSVVTVVTVVSYQAYVANQQREVEQYNAENREILQKIWSMEVQNVLTAVQRHHSSGPLYESYTAQYARCKACTVQVLYTGLESCQVTLFFPVSGGGLGQANQNYTNLDQIDSDQPDQLKEQIYEGVQQHADLDLITLPAEDEWQDHFQPIITANNLLVDPD